MLAAAAVLLAATIALLVVRRHRRRRAWADAFAAGVEQATWFARALMPSLAQAGSFEQLARTWQVSSAQVSAIEDQLTALESTAGEPDRAARARTLRDAVRSARVRVQTLLASADVSAARAVLATAAGEIEAALASIPPVIDASGRPPQRHPGASD